MKEINDNELSALINDTFERREMLKDIDLQVMKTIKTQKRQSDIRRWIRLLSFCFGFPLIIIFTLYTVCKAISFGSSWQAVAASMAFFIVTILFVAYKSVQRFSLSDV